jgi:acetyl-CoA synthetase-like protein
MSLITPIIQRWIDEGRRDPDALWARAADDLKWFRRWDRLFEWDPPTFRWFVGGQTNLGYNAVDRHVIDGNEPLLSIDHSRLERVVCAGEVLNPPAWDWGEPERYGRDYWQPSL